AANALRFYPLEDRLFFFTLPWLWLLAAAGIEGLLDHDWRRARPLILVLAIIPLLPGVVRYCYWTAVVPVKGEFREAFEYVRGREQPGDAWRVSHPEVCEVYGGRCRPAQGERVWVIVARGSDAAPILEQMARAHRPILDRHEWPTVWIILFGPSS